MMFRVLVVMLVLASGSTASAVDPDAALVARVVAFAPVIDPSETPRRMSCIGTLISHSTLLTASHCVPAMLTAIAIQCFSAPDEQESDINVTVTAVRRHPVQDVSLIRFEAKSSCHKPASALRISDAPGSRLSAFSQNSLSLHDVSLVQTQTHALIVSDTHCLTQGDSGSPVFNYDAHNAIYLSAMLISGTDNCPSLQVLTNLTLVSDWLMSAMNSFD